MLPYSRKFCNDALYTIYQKSSPIAGRTTNVTISLLLTACDEIRTYENNSEAEGKYSSPMVLIGIYISIASLFCILAMSLDLLNGFINRKFWFPTKFFSLNAASITVIAVAMKLQLDLSSPMPMVEQQVAKIGGLAFMCAMMSNMMTSLASMDKKSLLANVTGLSIFVITLIVNIFIQIRTHVINPDIFLAVSNSLILGEGAPSMVWAACIYMGILLFLLIIFISSAITFPTTKKILEFKYQATSKTTFNDQHPQESRIPNVEELRLLVKRYWIMAKTSSPQFVMASNPLSSASGMICLVTVLKLLEEYAREPAASNGVLTFDNDQFHSQLSVEHVNSWGLPIISLACIIVVIPNIHRDKVDNMFKSIGEGLLCTHLVEKSLNREPVYVNIRKATVALWREVEENYKWLDTTLDRNAYEGKTSREIVKSFAHIAEGIVIEFNTTTNGEIVEKENLPPKVIAANSMYRVAKTIMHTYESNDVAIIEDELFTRLSGMVADILAACLTNIPHAITMRCHESAIEKREASVSAAIDLLGQTTKIIEKLEKHAPSMDQDKMAYIDEWRLHLGHP